LTMKGFSNWLHNSKENSCWLMMTQLKYENLLTNTIYNTRQYPWRQLFTLKRMKSLFQTIFHGGQIANFANTGLEIRQPRYFFEIFAQGLRLGILFNFSAKNPPNRQAQKPLPSKTSLQSAHHQPDLAM